MAEWAFIQTLRGDARVAYAMVADGEDKITPIKQAHYELRLPPDIIAGNIDTSVDQSAVAYGTAETDFLTGGHQQCPNHEDAGQGRCVCSPVAQENMSPVWASRNAKKNGRVTHRRIISDHIVGST